MYNLCIGIVPPASANGRRRQDTRHTTVVTGLTILLSTHWIEAKMFGFLDTRICPQMHFLDAM